MEVRKLKVEDAENFSNLIVDMYSNLDNLEWFSPMPYDIDNVKGMISNERFYILGAFDNDKLVGVGSLDYKCGKLIGKIDFGSECDTSKLVELSFGIVHSDYRGKGIMKSLLSTLLEKIKNDGFEWAFAKIHKDNIASNKASMSNGLSVLCSYSKPVKKEDFIYLSSQSFFSEAGKEKAKSTLEKFKDSENIIVDYNILMKRI